MQPRKIRIGQIKLEKRIIRDCCNRLECRISHKCKTRPTSSGQKRRMDVRMMFLYATALLILAGGIQSTPVPAKFSFEVTAKIEVLCVHVSYSVAINCKTNDPSANVSLSLPKHLPSHNLPSLQGRLKRNGAIFTIQKAILHDGGKYYCVAEKNGKVIKREIYLYVAGIPNLSIVPYMSKRVPKGSKVIYTCKAHNATVCDNLQWSKVNGLMNDVRVTSPWNNNGVWETELEIEKAAFAHSGRYKCELSYHQDLLAEDEVEVTVSAPEDVKIITSSPSPIWVNNSVQELRIRCVASGFPYPTFTWEKDGKVIENCQIHEECAKTKRYLLTSYGLKIVQPRYPDDNGKFSCVARNDLGTDRRDFDVIIPVKPVLKKSVQTVYTWLPGRKQQLSIPCVLQQGATPDVTFTWQRQQIIHVPGYDYINLPPRKISKTDDKFEIISSPNHKGSVLKILSFPQPSRVNFVCNAANSKGSDKMTFEVAKLKSY